MQYTHHLFVSKLHDKQLQIGQNYEKWDCHIVERSEGRERFSYHYTPIRMGNTLRLRMLNIDGAVERQESIALCKNIV